MQGRGRTSRWPNHRLPLHGVLQPSSPLGGHAVPCWRWSGQCGWAAAGGWSSSRRPTTRDFRGLGLGFLGWYSDVHRGISQLQDIQLVSGELKNIRHCFLSSSFFVCVARCAGPVTSIVTLPPRRFTTPGCSALGVRQRVEERRRRRLTEGRIFNLGSSIRGEA